MGEGDGWAGYDGGIIGIEFKGAANFHTTRFRSISGFCNSQPTDRNSGLPADVNFDRASILPAVVRFRVAKLQGNITCQRLRDDLSSGVI